jgi:rubrerythrin
MEAQIKMHSQQDVIDHQNHIDSEINRTTTEANHYQSYLAQYNREIYEKEKRLKMFMILAVIICVVISIPIFYYGNTAGLCCGPSIILIGVGVAYFMNKFLRGGITKLENQKYAVTQKIHGALEIASNLNNAKNAEVAGRYNDAARIYEAYGLHWDAGVARRMDKVSYVEHSGKVMNIEVNLNQLLDQIRSRGLVIPYKCPQCGGSIQITGNTAYQSLVQCPYCSTQLYNMADFLHSIL